MSDDESKRLIPLGEGELAELIKTGLHLHCAFGIGGAALIWEPDTPMPEAVRRLGLIRGVLNQNMEGAGI